MVDERANGMIRFTIIWFGQVVSILGTAMTQFALMIWVWNHTHQATPTALMAFFGFIPMLLMSPIAGALVDRWDRKRTMLIGDIVGCLGSIAVLFLVSANFLQVWHLYVLGFCLGVFGAFQWPAYSSAITLMVDKKDYARADSMMGIAESTSMIFGPVLGALFLVFIKIQGVLIFDIFSFFFAICTLLAITIPNPQRVEPTDKGLKGVFRDAAFGFRYIRARPALLGLLMTFFFFNMISQFGILVVGPMVLARTGDNQMTLGLLMSVLGIGGLIGGIIMAIWGGPKRRINGLLGGMATSIIVGVAILHPSPYIWAMGGFIMMLTMPMTNGCSQAIWQTKTAPHVQGRVFGARRFIAQIASGIGMIAVGPLADKLFTPGMMKDGSLTGIFSWLIAPGAGAGMAIMVFITFTLCTVVAIFGYSIYNIRNVEDIVPDFDGEKVNQVKGNKKTGIEKDICKGERAKVTGKVDLTKKDGYPKK